MVLTFAAVGLSAFTYAQTGIGTVNPDNSAQLDITSNRRGLLIPRIALVKTTEQTPITAPAASLLVYNTANSNDVTPGFYYWDGKWVRIAKSEDFNIDNLTPEQITKIRGPQGVPGPQGDQGPTGPIGTVIIKGFF
ncbi:hypothetical protein BD847_3119 [Flavobacterium cutihirudinis]|uniref:Collagen triple helix repeat protein n=2 Tax=Flavobacterium cutihirudinis TaxID=1265740 RepID=A0A3D9FRS4_9FLAO|nr:hypothetical protein BD847_3119 [Flavobacterium cutihirudinis]